MSVKVKCPNCDRFILVESEEVGTKVKCILCSKPFTARPDWMADQTSPRKPSHATNQKKDLFVQEKKKKKEKQKAKEDEFLEPDVRWKPTPKETPDKFVTCPECGKKLPATAHICNRCGWNLVLGRQALEKGRSPAAMVLRFAIFASVLVLVGMAVGLGVRYFRAHWTLPLDQQVATQAPTAPTPQPSPPTKTHKPGSAGAAKPDKPAVKATRKPHKHAPRRVPKAPEPKKETAPPNPMASLAESVVIVKTQKQSGLGFIVDPTTALVVTNRHILEGGREITIVAFPHASPQGREFGRAAITAVHKKADVALISFNPRGAALEPALLASEAGVKKGDSVFTIVRTSTSHAREIEGAVAKPSQSISGMSTILTSAAVDARTSGAPLFDSAGSVIGINTYSDVWKPSAFALDIAYVRDLLDDPKGVSLSATEMDALLKQGIDPLRKTSSKGLLGRTFLPGAAIKMLVDRSGRAVYALAPQENSILVLSQNKVAASIFVGTNPTDFDITPNGKQLYVSVNQPTGISIVDLKKRARGEFVRLQTESAFGVRALAMDRALVICGAIYRPTLTLPNDRGPLAGVKVMVVNLRTRRVEQEIRNEAPLPVLKSITDRMPKKWTKKNMDTRREWQGRETFAERLFAFPVIARSPDGKEFYVAGYDEKTSSLRAKDLMAVFKYAAHRATRPEATGPDRIPLYIPEGVKARTINRKKSPRRSGPARPEFAQFPQTMLVSADGKTVLLGAAVINGENLQLMGTIKRNEEAYAQDPRLCNIQAAPARFKTAFSGANVFDMKTFTDIAPLPVKGTVLAVDGAGKTLHVFNATDNNVYSFDVHALLPQ
ncbi:MAG: hypothetical protein GXP25_01105 [Planctomycetes bacterium]|nr:hypothetical protein [Planctomycetota bacterium]